jgi:hypothetical protein
MKVEKTFHNIRCDACGCLLDEETWLDEEDIFSSVLLNECGWIECEGGRHYCPDCWQYDDDDNIVTTDGRKWTDNDYREIETEE